MVRRLEELALSTLMKRAALQLPCAEVFVPFMLAILLAVDGVSVPPVPGLYYLNPQGLRRIEGRAVTVEQSHSHLPLKETLPGQGIKSKAEVLSERAESRVTSTPVFYYRVPPGSEAAGAADLVLVRLKATHGHREFDLSSEGEWKPIKINVQVKAPDKKMIRRDVRTGSFPGELRPVSSVSHGSESPFEVRDTASATSNGANQPREVMQ